MMTNYLPCKTARIHPNVINFAAHNGNPPYFIGTGDALQKSLQTNVFAKRMSLQLSKEVIVLLLHSKMRKPSHY